MRGAEFLLVFPDAEPEVSYYKSILDLGKHPGFFLGGGQMLVELLVQESLPSLPYWLLLSQSCAGVFRSLKYIPLASVVIGVLFSAFKGELACQGLCPSSDQLPTHSPLLTQSLEHSQSLVVIET